MQFTARIFIAVIGVEAHSRFYFIVKHTGPEMSIGSIHLHTELKMKINPAIDIKHGAQTK